MMRPSQKTLLISIASFIGAVILLTGIARATIAPFISDPQSSKDANLQNTPMEELTEFTGISIRGANKVEIVRGDGWAVELSEEEEGSTPLIRQEGSTLILGHGKVGKGVHWGAWNNKEHSFTAKVTMPELESLAISGSSEIRIAGFTGDSLEVELSGASSLSGKESRYENLEISVNGAGNIDFAEVKSVNADIDGSGATAIELQMDGGELTGSITGIANVTYAGEVSRETIDVAGVGEVSKK